jgi:two-component system CheB/CheR fusion protein
MSEKPVESSNGGGGGSGEPEEPLTVREPGQPLVDRQPTAEGNGNGHADGDGQGADVTDGVQADRLAQPTGDEQPPRLPFPVVGIGGSAGAIEALVEFFKVMPSDAGIAFVIIQHLPPDHDSLLVDILSKKTRMLVQEVAEGMAVEPDHVYAIRPGRTVTIRNGKLHLTAPVEKRGHERPVDDFFRSLADEQRERAVCISMSGMGSNGASGAQAVKAVGGACIAQDPDSARFPHMPRAMIDAGLADFILKPADMPDVLVGYARHPYARGERPAEAVLRTERQAYNEIVAILRTRTRRDFSGYKRGTVVRRIQRRMGLNQLTGMGEYARTLRQNTTEAMALADDLMIHVTGFFRDAGAWEALRRRVIRPLIESREPDGTVRAWVTACSSGEEAYTLAILLHEEAQAVGKPLDIKVFATDMAERSLAAARAGVYPGGIEGEVPPERLDRYFEKDGPGYRIKKEVRELVVFAPQNVLQDPPFSRLDLATCRNLLIYLEPALQERVLKLLHFGLREGGSLFLGTSETVGGLGEFYEPVDKKWRIYRRVGPARPGAVVFPMPVRLGAAVGVDIAGPAGDPPAGARVSVGHATQRALLERYTPPSVVIDREHRVTYYHGKTERFLAQPTGEPTRDLLELAREDVRGAVRQALQKAIEDNVPATAFGGWVESLGSRARIEVAVAPLDPRLTPGYFLVSFLERPDPAPSFAAGEDLSEDARVLLEGDLRQMREELQSTIEELQTSNEELKASNEEVTSVNEELQSANEELETGKEELQSLNEELTTVNTQLQTKMEELESTTNDLTSLLASADVAVLFLDRQFRIRRFTPAVADLMDMLPSDVGRPLSDLALKFEDAQLLPDARAVLDRLIPIDREVVSRSGRWYTRRVLPYRTADNRIDGVVITFLDISRVKGAEAALREHEDEYRLIFESVREYAIFTTGLDGQIKTWSPGAERILGYRPEEAIGQNCGMIFTPEDRLAGEPQKERESAKQTGRAMDERWHVRKDGSRFWASGVMSRLEGPGGEVRGLVKVLRDNTDFKRAQEALEEAKRASEVANETKDQFLATISHELRTPLSAILIWGKSLERAAASGAAPDVETVREATDAIVHSAQAQKHLIEDLLDHARIASGKLRLNLVGADLAAVVRSAVDSIRPTAREKGVELHVGEVADVGAVRVDAERIEQVMWNLLSNGVKFTPEGGQVAVALARHGDEVRIRVTDSGQGITDEFLPQLFDRFSQAESGLTGGKGGLGLGLAIVRQLVELHGGTVTAESGGANRGATFTVRLPAPEVRRRGKKKR